MSDTPRTDAAILYAGLTNYEVISPIFARKLERENAMNKQTFLNDLDGFMLTVQELREKLAEQDRQLSSIFSRYVPVEDELRRMAVGKLPLPDKEKCLELATRLGTPFGLWPEKLRRGIALAIDGISRRNPNC